MAQAVSQLIQGFLNRATENIYDGVASRVARRCLPQSLWRVATRKLDQLNRVVTLDELKVPPGNHLEALKRDRKGQHSIRINEKYRVCFVWTEQGPDDVEIVDYH